MTMKLTDLELHEVSLVDAPANPGARVLLFKSADPLAVTIAKAEAHVSAGEVAEAVRLAKMRTPAPPSFWRGHISALAKAHTADGVPPNMAMNLALNTPDGRELLAALHRAETPR
jgi:hypothetical protein